MRRFFVLILWLVVAAAAFMGWQQYGLLDEPYKGYPGPEQFVDIPPGTGSQAIGRSLTAAGVVSDPVTWRVALWRSGDATRLQAGEYRFTDAMTPADVIRKIARGEVYLRTITFREGLTVRQMGRVYEEAGFGPASAFVAATHDAQSITDLDPAARDLEGYLFPDTYALPRRASAEDLVRMMVERFRAAFTDDMRQAAASAGFGVREVVTLASLVEKETAQSDERAVVAGVFRNRLAKRMGLQCDPTVIYALELQGGFDGNLRRADLGLDSPYNTYRHAGLPPGPIAAPGRASLDAAAHPADVDYLYFVSRNDGSHVFAATLDEHNRNVFRYQVAPSRARSRR
ncbi:MAG: endolytic transglycosylase MltG [Acidobacteria bacterium]|nr:endolytic transglycosylase MltG [Acidobacteriota bacterium]